MVHCIVIVADFSEPKLRTPNSDFALFYENLIKHVTDDLHYTPIIILTKIDKYFQEKPKNIPIELNQSSIKEIRSIFNNSVHNCVDNEHSIIPLINFCGGKFDIDDIKANQFIFTLR